MFISRAARASRSVPILDRASVFHVGGFLGSVIILPGDDRHHLLEGQLPDGWERIAFPIGLPPEHLPRLFFHP
jgi:hypothetical protein